MPPIFITFLLIADISSFLPLPQATVCVSTFLWGSSPCLRRLLLRCPLSLCPTPLPLSTTRGSSHFACKKPMCLCLSFQPCPHHHLSPLPFPSILIVENVPLPTLSLSTPISSASTSDASFNQPLIAAQCFWGRALGQASTSSVTGAWNLISVEHPHHGVAFPTATTFPIAASVGHNTLALDRLKGSQRSSPLSQWHVSVSPARRVALGLDSLFGYP